MVADRVATAAATVARPCFLEAGGRYLFAWHHVARDDVRRGVAVVLCPPLGFDYICVYRSWRILAQELAGLGFDVLRIDYDGTGNSAGTSEEPGRLDAWRLSIDRAIAAAQALAGANRVALVGLRFGATLAVEVAAARGGVSRLVLWSPFRTGRAYLREMKAFARMFQENDAPPPDGGDMESAGHVVTRETADALEQLDLDALLRCPAPDVLLVDRDDRPPDSWLGAHLEQLGSRLTRCRPEGTAAMLVQPALSTVPRPVIDEITGWLRNWSPLAPSPLAREASARAAPRLACGPGYRERAVDFGPDGRLFGILTEPERQNLDAPAIILFTTGTEYHVGPNRFYVPLARRWAADGHVVLRYDLGGIGDSLAPPGIADNVAYPEHALGDARAAIALVRGDAFPARRVIVLGLCSGGWLAFRAALLGLPIDSFVAINPPLYLRDGSAGMQCATNDSEFERYRRLLVDRTRWSKVLHGRAAYRAFFRLCCGFVWRRFLARVNTICDGRLIDGLAPDLDAISARGIPGLFVFSRGDRGLHYFQLHGGAGRRDERRRRGIEHVVVVGAGHTFRPLGAQRELRTRLIDFVARQTPRADRMCAPAQPEITGETLLERRLQVSEVSESPWIGGHSGP